MEVSGSPETLNYVLKKGFLTNHCYVQRVCTEAAYPVVLAFAAGFSSKQFAKMLFVVLNIFLTSEVFHFCFLSEKNTCKRGVLFLLTERNENSVNAIE